MLSVDDWVGIGSLELAGRAAEAIRELNHRTRGPGAFTGPAELYRLVAELVVLAGGMPQLLGQLDRWLRVEHDAGRVRSDDRADPGPTVRGAARDWVAAGAAAHDLAHVLAAAQQRLSHLGVAGRLPAGL
jgi:hypothetical protein